MNDDYSGERFLNKIYKNLKDSNEVKHTAVGSNSNLNVRRYLERLSRIHDKASKRDKISRLLNLYYRKYVVKPVNINPKRLNGNTIEGIIKAQEDSLSSWIYYLSSETADYPVWTKYWAFQGMLNMGTYDASREKYSKRTTKTIAPFVDCNPELVAHAISLIVKYNHGKELDDKEVERLVSTGSFSKIYGYLLQNYKVNKNNNSDYNDGVWIKYNQGSLVDAKKLSESLKGKNTGWCTASEQMAKRQLCGEYYNAPDGGDFYVYYTKEGETYSLPRIAIRMSGTSKIGEIRGVADNQNLEEGLEDILENKLDSMDGLNPDDKANYINKIQHLKKLDVIEKKSIKGYDLDIDEIRLLYDFQYSFGWDIDGRIQKIVGIRVSKHLEEKDYNVLSKSIPSSDIFFSDEIWLLEKMFSRFKSSNSTYKLTNAEDAGHLLSFNPRNIVFIDVNIPEYEIFAIEAINKTKTFTLFDYELYNKRPDLYKRLALYKITEGKRALEYLPPELFDTEEGLEFYELVAQKEIDIYISGFEKVSDGLLNSKKGLEVYKNLALRAVVKHSHIIRFLSEKLFLSEEGLAIYKEIIMKAMETDDKVIELISDKYKKIDYSGFKEIMNRYCDSHIEKVKKK